jgi:hypothetical protein
VTEGGLSTARFARQPHNFAISNLEGGVFKGTHFTL